MRCRSFAATQIEMKNAYFVHAILSSAAYMYIISLIYKKTTKIEQGISRAYFKHALIEINKKIERQRAQFFKMISTL